MEGLVGTKNVGQYVERLEIEQDSSRRQLFQALLIDEEDRLGSRKEQLQQIERFIHQARARLNHQELIIARLSNDGADTATAEKVKGNMVDLLRLLDGRRESLKRALATNHPSDWT